MATLRRIGTLTAGLMLAATGLVASAGTATAASTTDIAAQRATTVLAADDPGTDTSTDPASPQTLLTCYGSASYVTFYANSTGNAFWPARGTYATTTSACSDINIKPRASNSFTVCFHKTGKCNGWHYAPSGQWTVIASQVLDPTEFYVAVNGHSSVGTYLAY